jgi:PAS domain S-box-containing protein
MTKHDTSSARQWRHPAAPFLLLILYVFAGKLGLALAFVHANATAVWAPSGIALAGLLVLGYRVWPAIFLGAFLVNISTAGLLGSAAAPGTDSAMGRMVSNLVANLTSAGPLVTSLGIATGNTLEGLFGAWLVERFAGGRNAFDRASTVFLFAALAGALSTMVSAAVGVASLCLGGLAQWTDGAAIGLTWWLGDAAGDLVVAPLFLLWTAKARLSWSWPRTFEGALVLLVLFAVSQVEFGGWIEAGVRNSALTFLCIPTVVWAAFRFGQREAVTVTTLLSAMAIWGTLNGHGPFVRPTANESLIFLQTFMGVTVVLALAVGAVVSEQRQTERALRSAQEELELRVKERTAELAEVNQALRASQAKLAEAQQIAQVGSWEWDITRNIVTWSDELYRVFGLRPRESVLTFERFLDQVHGQDRAFVRETIEGAFRDHRPFSLDHRIVRPDGSERVVHGRGEVMVDEAGQAFQMIGTCQDITERKQAEAELFDAHNELEKRVQERTGELAAANVAFLSEIAQHKRTAEALRESQTKLQAIFENSIDAISVSHAAIHVLVNPAYLRLFGYGRPEELVGRPVVELIAVSQRAFIQENIRRRIQGEAAPAHYETRGLRRNGTEFDLEVDVSSYALHGELFTLAILRDISERKQAEEARNRLAAIVESSDDAIMSKTLDGTIVSWNAGAQRIFGYSPEEIVGKSIDLLIPPEYLEQEPGIRARLKRGERMEHYETARLHKEGRRVDVSLTISPIQDAAGRVIGASQIARDITERKRIEAEVHKLNEELEQRVRERTAQLEAINKELESFTYSVSHDLRAPLRALQGLSNALVEDYADRIDGTGREYCHRIAVAAGRMDTLIQDLLAYSRLSRIDLEVRAVDVAAVIADVRHHLESDLQEKNAQLTVPEPLPEVMGHRATLGQVVGNLVANAIKFVAPGVTPRVTIRSEENGEFIRVWIEDNGIGVAPEFHGRIFRVFERLHGVETYPGTGIGLAIVQKGVERLGGRAGVESSEGEGSRFWIELKKAPVRQDP